MLDPAMAERLKAARIARGFESARSAAIENGWTPSTYAAHENGQNGISATWARKYATAYHVSAGWLLTGEGAGPPRIPRLRTVWIEGKVEAGAWEETFALPRDDRYLINIPDNAPHCENLRLFAVEVRGSSMDRVYPEGSVVVCVDLRARGEAPQAGKRYVVEREHPDGSREYTLKTVSSDSEGTLWLVPESNDPRFSQAIPMVGAEGEVIRLLGRVCYSVRPE